MPLPQDLYPRRGDLVKPWAQRLLAWAESLDVVLGGEGLQKTVTPNGTDVTYVAATHWAHPFQVFASTEAAVVSMGEVNSLVPRIGDVGLDQRDKNGKEVDAPSLEISTPEDGRSSWVCLQAKVDPETGELLDPEGDKWPLEIVYRTELPPSIRQGGSEDEANAAIFPLAILKWSIDGASLADIFQIVHHNLGHRFLPAKGSGPGRHFFWGV